VGAKIKIKRKIKFCETALFSDLVSLSLQPQLLRALTLIIILPNSAYFGAKPSNSCISANYINKNTRFQPRVFWNLNKSNIGYRRVVFACSDKSASLVQIER
jgi:hypothetical protein